MIVDTRVVVSIEEERALVTGQVGGHSLFVEVRSVIERECNL